MAWNKGRFEKDDPWAMVKLAGEIAREETQLAKGLEKRRESEKEYTKLMASGMHPDRFTVFKKSVDGENRCWGHQRRKTLEECQDLAMFPTGKHSDVFGEFVWTFCLTNEL